MVRWRWYVAILTCIVTGFLGSHLPDLRVEQDYRVFVDPSDPLRLGVEQFERTFESAPSLVFVVKSPSAGGSPSSARDKLIENVVRLTRALLKLEYVREVASVATVAKLTSEGECEVPRGTKIRSDVPAIRDLIDNASYLRGYLVADDTKALAVVVGLKEGVLEGASLRGRIVDELYSLGQDHGDVHLFGPHLYGRAMVDAMRWDLTFLAPLLIAGCVLIFRLAFGSTYRVLVALVVIGAAVTGTFGVVAWLGWKVTVFSFSSLFVVATIATADVVHVVSAYVLKRERNMSRRDALTYSLELNLRPMFITSVTTALGVLSLTFSPSPPVRDLGMSAAIGVGFAFVMAVTLLPALLAPRIFDSIRVSPARDTEDLPKVLGIFSLFFGESSGGRSRIESLAHLLIRRRVDLLVLTVVLTGGCLWKTFGSEVDDNPLSWFAAGRIPVGAAVEAMDNAGFGLRSIYVTTSVHGGEEGTIFESRKVRSFVSSFAEWWSLWPDVVSVLHYDLLANDLLESASAGRSPSKSTLGDLEEFNFRCMPVLRDLVGNDHRSAAILIEFGRELSNRSILRLSDFVREWIHHRDARDYTRANVQKRVVGEQLMFARMIESNARSMAWSAVSCCLMVVLVIGLFYRSCRLVYLSVLPNVLPIAIVYAAWSEAGSLDLGGVALFSTAFGILVDDTVHLIDRYRRASAAGGPAEAWVAASVRLAGRPLLITTCVLSTGFIVLGGSSFLPSASLGLMVGLALWLAILLDFVVFLPMLTLWKVSQRSHMIPRP